MKNDNDKKDDNQTQKAESPLSAMGIKHPAEIVRYKLRHEGDEDVLKIYYRRKKGSLFPASRKYKFGRSSRSIITDSGKPEYVETQDISPFLLEAVAELNKIVAPPEDPLDTKQEILSEIDRLEKSFSRKLDDLRSQIEKL